MKPHKAPPRDELFELVQSLSRTEKRYLKTFSAHGKSEMTYLALFDALCKEKVYDEKAFKARHAGKRFMTYFSQTKRFLKTQILRAMRSYHEDRLVEDTVNDFLRDFHFLVDKGMYDFAWKQLMAAEKLALERQLDFLLLRISQLKVKFKVEHARKFDDLQAELQDFVNDQEQFLSRLKDEMLYLNTYRQCLLESRRSGGSDIVTTGLERLPVPDFSQPGRYSFDTLVAYLSLQVLSAEAEGRLDRVHLHFQTLLDLFADHQRDRKEDFKRNIKLIANYLNSCLLNKDERAFSETFSRLKELEANAKTDDDHAEILQNSIFFQILRAIRFERWQHGQTLLPEVLDLLNHPRFGNKVNITRALSLFYNSSVIALFCEDWKELMAWVQRMLKEQKSGFRQSAMNSTRILAIIALYELEEWEAVMKKRRSILRNSEDPEMRELVKRIARINDAAILDRPELFGRLADWILEKIESLPHSKIGPGWQEMYYWAKSRWAGVSMIEALQRYRLPGS